MNLSDGGSWASLASLVVAILTYRKAASIQKTFKKNKSLKNDLEKMEKLVTALTGPGAIRSSIHVDVKSIVVNVKDDYIGLWDFKGKKIIARLNISAVTKDNRGSVAHNLRQLIDHVRVDWELRDE